MDRLQSMRVFQRVVDEGGFAAAARRMDLDPAAVTRLVLDLEKHLGSRLLQRSTRRLALTPAGEDYLARLRPLLAGIDEADASIRGQVQDLRGRLRLLAPPVVATHMVAPSLPAFHDRHPEIQVDLRTLDMADPPYEEYDLTFQAGGDPVPADMVAREVTRANAVLCASPAYLQRHGTPQAPDDLRAHRLLRLRPPGSARVGPLRLVHPSNGREHLVEAPPVLVANHTDTLLRAALEGGGIGSHTEDIAAPFLLGGQLQRVVAPWITNQLRMVAIYPSGRFLAARARLFLDHITAHARSRLEMLAADARKAR